MSDRLVQRERGPCPRGLTIYKCVSWGAIYAGNSLMCYLNTMNHHSQEKVSSATSAYCKYIMTQVKVVYISGPSPLPKFAGL